MIWRKVEATGVVVLAGLLFLAIMIFGYLMFIDGTLCSPPLIYETQILRTDKDVYHPGDVVSVFLDVYKARDIQGFVTWELVNGRVFPYARRELQSPSGSYEKWFPLENEALPTANLEHPDTLYHFQALVEYPVNKLRTVTYKLVTTPFRIIPRDLKENQG
jgi:hypothetical protein